MYKPIKVWISLTNIPASLAISSGDLQFGMAMRSEASSKLRASKRTKKRSDEDQEVHGWKREWGCQQKKKE